MLIKGANPMTLAKRIVRVILLITILMVAAFFWLRRKYQEPLIALAQTQVMNTTSDMINDAISNQMAESDIPFDRIVYFEKNLDGRITALKTNISEINRLKTQTLDIINDEILALDSSDLGIPLGNLFLPEIMSGRGPSLPVEIITVQNSDASFSSNFTQAGINQTLHQINMSVVVDVVVLVFGHTESFTVGSEMVVAETIIVGDVPDAFFQTGGTYDTKSP